MPLFRRATALMLATTAFAAAGCSSSEGGTKVSVTGTNTGCELTEEDLPAGKLAFQFTNRADDVNELYVLRNDGSVVGEVEGVTTGTSRVLNVDLVAGDYQVRCKPGQTGKGFSSRFEVTGSGGTAQKAPDRTITFKASDFTYQELDLTDVKKGETIRFEMTNDGDQPHEFEVLDPDGEAIGEVEALDPKKSGAATVTFAEAGTYTYQCILKDPASDTKHTMLGMTGTFEVK